MVKKKCINTHVLGLSEVCSKIVITSHNCCSSSGHYGSRAYTVKHQDRHRIFISFDPHNSHLRDGRSDSTIATAQVGEWMPRDPQWCAVVRKLAGRRVEMETHDFHLCGHSFWISEMILLQKQWSGLNFLCFWILLFLIFNLPDTMHICSWFLLRS